MPTDPQAVMFGRQKVLKTLDSALDALRWAVKLIDDEQRLHFSPSFPGREATWSAAMNLAHLTLYEERLPRSVLSSLLAGGDGVSDTWFREPTPWDPDAIELATSSRELLLERMERAYASTKTLSEQFTEEEWTRPCTKAWTRGGMGLPLNTPARIVAKSAQHVVEHSNGVLQIGLFTPRQFGLG